MQRNSISAVYRHLTRTYIVIKAKPGSKKEGIFSIEKEHVVVCIKAPPVEGKANAALVEFFSEIFHVSKSDVCLEKGGTSRTKLISVSDCFTVEEILKILNDNLL